MTQQIELFVLKAAVVHSEIARVMASVAPNITSFSDEADDKLADFLIQFDHDVRVNA